MTCASTSVLLGRRAHLELRTQEDPGKGTVAGIIGWVLAHRRVLIVAYLVLLHGLVYFALTHGVFSAKEAPVCSPVRATASHRKGAPASAAMPDETLRCASATLDCSCH